MKRFLNWFKKNPLIHGIILLSAIPAAILILVVSIYIYGFAIMFNPNYEEFGPRIALYKAQDCAEINTQSIRTSDCLLLGFYLESMWKNNPKTLDKVVEGAANVKERDDKQPILIQFISAIIFSKRLPALEGYPEKGNQWICSKNGEIILYNTKELAGQTFYKCWPK